ncbi:MAG TPA: alanine--glyoxylate aminotransferase family protein [Methanomicrobia archaeon]|nr:alanine--glyoxylate aminotransferase family protein [Methanomicrobia archaeon]
MIPGPVPVIKRIRETMARPMIFHRGDEFAQILRESVDGLKNVFQTKNDLFVLSGSGTCAMEAAVGNLLTRAMGTGEPEINVVTVANGKFGERFTEIAERYGGPRAVTPLHFEWGTGIELEGIKAALESTPNSRIVTMVHNETSVGMLNPARAVGKLAKQHDALFVLDCITSIGGDEVPVDQLGADIAIVGSQKCLGVPPGLAALSVSEKAWELIRANPSRPYYQDLIAHKKSLDKDQTPYTPALPLFYALHEALKVIAEEGMPNRIARHRTMAKAVRAAITENGLSLFPRLNEVSQYSNTVTAVNMPVDKGISDSDLRPAMRKKGVVVAGGQGDLKGKIFRIATMGNITSAEIFKTLEVLEAVLYEQKAIEKTGNGLAAARALLAD